VIALIFAGPTISPERAPETAGLEWWPPARQGDIYKATLSRPAAIGLVDGYFEVIPSVWHKEILWAMARGIHVYGASSIGALRAAELADFGMKGVGVIYEQFRAGTLTNDDEVAVLHGPPEIGYVQLTDAMVDVRATVRAAWSAGIVDDEIADALIRIAEDVHYKRRTYELVLKTAVQRGFSSEALERFAAWLPTGRVDQKRLDAIEMIGVVRDHLASKPPPLRVAYDFQQTIYWEEARERADTEMQPARKRWRWF
jgi:hypothetical protein